VVNLDMDMSNLRYVVWHTHSHRSRPHFASNLHPPHPHTVGVELLAINVDRITRLTIQTESISVS